MILQIDTKDQKKIKVSLKKNGKVLKSLSRKNKYGSQVLLPLIQKLLQTANCPLRPRSSFREASEASKLQTLQSIDVNTGPGSFTGLRVGVSVANALGFSLDIPVNRKKIETNLVY